VKDNLEGPAETARCSNALRNNLNAINRDTSMAFRALTMISPLDFRNSIQPSESPSLAASLCAYSIREYKGRTLFVASGEKGFARGKKQYFSMARWRGRSRTRASLASSVTKCERNLFTESSSRQSIDVMRIPFGTARSNLLILAE